jgi:hypothetical protein
MNEYYIPVVQTYKRITFLNIDDTWYRDRGFPFKWQKRVPSMLGKPITLDLLSNIVQILPHIAFSTYEVALFSAAFTLAFFWRSLRHNMCLTDNPDSANSPTLKNAKKR